jgi:osmoprotectant transport system permease protein
MRLLEFLLTHHTEFLWALLRHVLLVATATGAAILLGVPLGVLAHQRPRIGAPLLGFANLVQTIPSLALFGFLIPLPWLGGIGVRSALVALILYALLPVMRGTVNGLQSVEPGFREAALALGLTETQTLRHVLLPLSRPAILNGIRVATVVSIGTATIAAAIGAGGLGEYIFRGVASLDTTVILAGTVPAALLALLADFGFSKLAHWAAPGRARAPHTSRVWLALGAAALLFVGVSSVLWFARSSKPSLVIGAKDFPEQTILGELLAQAIERDTGLAVTRKFHLGDTLICEQAMLAGELDGYVEYTGTALTSVFKQPVLLDPDEVTRRVAAGYATTGRTMLAPLGFNNTFVILVRRADAERLGIKTISAAVPHARQWRAGFGPAFLDREDGYHGLAQTYSLQFAEPPRAMNLSLTYRALADKQLDLIAGDATNGLIAKLDLFPLTDDRRYFPPYHAVPVMLTRTLERYPQLHPALKDLANAVSDETMRRMNYAVEIEKREPAVIVREFLRQLKK